MRAARSLVVPAVSSHESVGVRSRSDLEEGQIIRVREDDLERPSEHGLSTPLDAMEHSPDVLRIEVELWAGEHFRVLGQNAVIVQRYEIAL